MTEVVLHIYDVTNSGSEKTNNTILQINRFFKDGIRLGGIFHSAIQVIKFPLRGSSVCVFTCTVINFLSGGDLSNFNDALTTFPLQVVANYVLKRLTFLFPCLVC